MSKSASAFDGLVDEMEDGLEPEVPATEEQPEPVEAAPDAAPADPEPEQPPAAKEPAQEPAQAASEEPERDAAPGAGGETEEAKDARLEAEAKKTEALRKRLVEMRYKARMAQARAEGAQAPNPAAQAAQPPVTQVAQQTGEDGLIWEDGRARVDPAYIERIVEQRMRPDPAAVTARREEDVRRSFVGLDEGARDRSATFSRADEAMSYFQLRMWELSQSTGADLSRFGVDGILDVASESGLMAEIQEHYPDIAPHIPDFLVAGTLPEAHGDIAMRQALLRYHADRMRVQAPKGAPVRPAAIPNTAKQQVRSDRPPSTAKAGSPPTGDNASSKKQREEMLTDKLAANPFNGLSSAEQKELDALRADLGL